MGAARIEKVNYGPEASYYSEVRMFSKDNDYVSKGHRSQLEGGSTSQVWDYFSSTINTYL